LSGAAYSGGKKAAEGGTAGEIAVESAKGGALGLVISGAFEGVRALVKPSPKMASVLTNTPKERYKTAAQSTYQQMNLAREAAEDPLYLQKTGENIYDSAKEIHKEAQNVWSAKESEAFRGVDIDNARASIQSAFDDTFKADRVNILDDQFGSYRANKTAVEILKAAKNELLREIPDPTDLIVAREAIANIDTGLDRVAGRVKGKVLEAFDKGLTAAGGEGYKLMREEYAKTAGPALDLLKAFESKGEFSPDKAASFLKEVSGISKVNKQEILAELGKVAGKDFVSDIKRYGAAIALSKLGPPTGGRVLDVVTGLGLTRVPVISGLFSPFLWGSVITGSQSAQKAVSNLTARAATLFLQKIAED
jgi:hypothetical protein